MATITHCDKCNDIITRNTDYGLITGRRHKFDLCETCMAAIGEWIKTGRRSQRGHDSRLLTIAEVGTRLSLSKRSVQRLMADGQLQRVKMGSSIRVSEKQLAAFIAGGGGG
jgi:excisionase family DNA binding protein